jgi:putative restriction endonuclease
LLTLLLLVRAQALGSRVVSYGQVHAPLKKLLHDFGPPRKSYHPEYPFWYLRNDGFWDVHDADALPRRKAKNQPTHAALLQADAKAEVPADLWQALLDQPELVSLLARSLLEEFFEDTLHESIATAIGLDIGPTFVTSCRRSRDPKFRGEVLRAWQSRCAVCGFDARLGDTLFGLEAAHIHSHRFNGPDTIQNGLALCSLHHKAFDFGAISLDQDLRVLVSEEVAGRDAVTDTLIRYAGRRLDGPQRDEYKPNERFINWHHKEVFRGPARA